MVRGGMEVMGAPGFDDAPVVTVPLGGRKPVQFIYPYYENPQFLAAQISGWLALPEELQQLLRIIVVDDGSPMRPAEAVIREMPETTFGLHWLSAPEWFRLLDQAELSVEALYGWFDGRPYDGEEDMVFVTRRR